MRRSLRILSGRIVIALIAVALLAVPALPAAAADPTPSPGAAGDPGPSPSATDGPEEGTLVCTVTDPRATELSGLVATPSGYVAINDSNDDASRIKIFYFDPTCKLVKTVGYPTAARDPEDLAQAPDGTLWVADIGDNVTSAGHRNTIALWHVPADGSAPVIYRLSYPDGPHDAEALFFTPTGTPVIVTKEIIGTSGIYEPTGPLVPKNTTGVPMKLMGTFSPTATGVPNLLGKLGEVLVTGAATSPDRRRVALRTYGAVYEWDVPDGDPVKAITTGVPRVTALPNEPQGESIAYTVDGQAFLTISDQSGPSQLRRYEPWDQAITPSAAATPVHGRLLTPVADQPVLARDLARVPGWAMVVVAAAGLFIAGIGFFGLHRSRRDA
jgi:hypothetical protein